MAGVAQVFLTDHELDTILAWGRDAGRAHPDDEAKERRLYAKLVGIRRTLECGCEGGTARVVMDYPQAWEFVRATKPEDHHERCSWRTTNGALLCDCDVLWDEYERRGGIGDARFPKEPS